MREKGERVCLIGDGRKGVGRLLIQTESIYYRVGPRNCSGCSASVAQPFMTKCYVPEVFWIFNHQEVHLNKHHLIFSPYGCLHLSGITLQTLSLCLVYYWLNYLFFLLQIFLKTGQLSKMKRLGNTFKSSKQLI